MQEDESLGTDIKKMKKISLSASKYDSVVTALDAMEN